MNTHFHKSILASAIALAILGTSVAASGETVSQDVINARQETQIWTTYALSPYLRANDLKVSVESGKATLTGSVEESVNKDLAKQIALGVDGIKSVDNQIVVQSDYTPPQAILGADLWRIDGRCRRQRGRQVEASLEQVRRWHDHGRGNQVRQGDAARHC